MDFEVQRCTRRCHKTGRELAPQEEFFSTLVSEGAKVVRRDFCREAWEGPPEESLGWWKSKMPSPSARRVHWAPNDIMVDYFEQLEQEPGKQDVRYILALLMIRRRLARLEETQVDDAGIEQMVLYCPRRESTYHVAQVTLDDDRVGQIQEELAELLFADGT